jgi:long-subunit acyl-CoA synthetase (AMP-forming)
MVCKGYFVDPSDPDPDVVAKNKSEFVQDTDGVTYFCTGDIGQVNRNGCVQIIDRKKDLVKLQQGEYVALSKVENAMKNCTLVEVPCCYAESTYDYCVALVCPSHLALKALAKTLGVASEDVAVLCEDPKIVAEVSKQILAAVKGKLTGFEIPKKVALIADTFTPENEMLTSAFKLKRKPIADQHRAVLNKLYGKK